MSLLDRINARVQSEAEEREIVLREEIGELKRAAEARRDEIALLRSALAQAETQRNNAESRAEQILASYRMAKQQHEVLSDLMLAEVKDDRMKAAHDRLRRQIRELHDHFAVIGRFEFEKMLALPDLRKEASA